MKTSIESQIIEGMEEFLKVLESDEPLEKHFKVRKVVSPLRPKALSPRNVKKARQALGISRAEFARFLGVSPKTVHAWEEGINRPSNLARRFIEEIQANPALYRERLKEVLLIA